MDRTRVAGASPLGLVLRTEREDADPPFPGWSYFPDYFEEGLCLHVGDNSAILEEPLCVAMPSNLPTRSSQPLSREPFTTVTEVRVGVPVGRPSEVLRAVGEIDGIRVELEEPHCMEIVFDDERRGRSRDLSPALPLVVRW